MTYCLLVVEDDDITLPGIHGPFKSVDEAQEYARRWREDHGIPGHENVQPTFEENEAWTEAGWYFGIHPILKDAPR